MKTTNTLKTLMALVKTLQKSGCIVSQTGHITLPFRVTTKALTLSTAQVRKSEATKLARWVKRSGLEIKSGEFGVSKSVTLMKNDTPICKIVSGKDGFQFRPTKNWIKAKTPKSKSSNSSTKVRKIPTRAKLLKRQAGRAH